MSYDCPHTHQPTPHVAEFDDAGNRVQSCKSCGGLIRRCPVCDTLNRRAAAFCRHCGNKLTAAIIDDERLVAPGELERRLQEATELSLEEIFQIPEAAAPVHWLISADGLFLFVEQTYLGQANIYRAPLTAFPAPTGGLLTSSRPLPATDRWVDEPFATKHGLFLAVAEALHFFPTHGDADYLVQRAWPVPPGYRIEALCQRDDGQCVLLLCDAEASGPTSTVLVYDGNTQTQDWRLALALELPAAQGYGYAAGPAHGTFEADIWVYNGSEVVFVSLGPAPLATRRFSIDHGQEPLRELKDRIRRGFFQPFVMTSATQMRQFVFPGKPRNGALASIAVLDLTTSGSRIWGDLRIGDWLRPDPWGEGLIVRRGKRLEHVVSGATSWEREGDFAGVPPTLTQDWMLAVKSSSAGSHGDLDSSLQLNLFELVRKADGIAIDSLTTYPTGYRAIAGLTPLTADGWLVYAGGADADATPTVAIARLVE